MLLSTGFPLIIWDKGSWNYVNCPQMTGLLDVTSDIQEERAQFMQESSQGPFT